MNQRPSNIQQPSASSGARPTPPVQVGFVKSVVGVARAWDLLWVAVLLIVGVGALAFAMVKLVGVSLALALIAIPGALIAWCMVKASYPGSDDE